LSNSDVEIDLSFNDLHNVPITPTSISIELDDITNSIAMLSPTVLVSTGSSSGNVLYPAFTVSPFTLQLTAALMQMSFPYSGSQICQLGITFTGVDSVTGFPFTGTGLVIIELCAVATVSGQAP
jgi:hypothetical protein